MQYEEVFAQNPVVNLQVLTLSEVSLIFPKFQLFKCVQ